jgi:succinate dehydrogenase/fumarate reductase flavoprotein subunit
MNQQNYEIFDVVVVGGGGSGLAAAVEAARFGRKVVLLEKNASLGGTTIRSVGSVTSTCTELQRAKGVHDVPQAHFEDMALLADNRGFADEDNLELRRLLVENSPDTVQWLVDMGVLFFGPMPEPPHRLPRMHNVLPHASSYIYHMKKLALRRGVDIRLNTRVVNLTRDSDRITGVEITDDRGDRRSIGATLGVILATGDYSSDKGIKSQFMSEEMADVEGINPSSTGDGQRLVQEAGGSIVNGDIMLGPEIRFVAPRQKKLLELIPPIKPIAFIIRWSMDHLPSWLLRPFLMMFVTTNLAPSLNLFAKGAVLINKEGERFVDERDTPQLAIPRQPERIAYVLLDDKIAREFSEWPNFISTAPGVAYAYLADYRRNRKDIFNHANTLKDLAGKLGMKPEVLEASVAEYNRSRAKDLPAIDQAPYYALGPVKSWIVFTDGGARINSNFEVLDHNRRPIPGLFAVGSAGQGGLLLEGHGHHLGWAFTSGRLAGRRVALGSGEWKDAALAARRASSGQKKTTTSNGPAA